MHSKLADDIAVEMCGEVLRSRIEGNEIVVLLVDGRKIRRPLATRFAEQIVEAVSTNEEQTAPPVSIPNQHKKGKGK